jgi:hypothetical protein
MKKIFALLVLVGIVITTTHSRAANLNDAVGTLPGDEEWSIMARAVDYGSRVNRAEFW